MKLLLFSIIFLLACHNNKTPKERTFEDNKATIINSQEDDSEKTGNFWIDKLNGNKYDKPDSFANRPASFYLNNPNVSPLAKALYNGTFRPEDEDNDSTTELLKLIITDNSEIRPFYRWCLDLTIQISDGALAEYPGEPALKYAIKFPKEFLEYLNNDTSWGRYSRWTEIITYSGLPAYNKDSTDNYNYIVQKMSANCKGCPKQTIDSIKQFAKDVTAGLRNLD